MKKLRGCKGTTMTEMLCVVLILAVVGTTMITGLHFGIQAFGKSVSRSEAKILCSTLAAAVKDELRYAGTTADGDDPTFFSQKSGENTRLTVSDQGIIQLEFGDESKNLVSPGTYTYGARADIAVNYDSTRGMFTVTITVTGPDQNILATNTFQIHRIGHQEASV